VTITQEKMDRAIDAKIEMLAKIETLRELTDEYQDKVVDIINHPQVNQQIEDGLTQLIANAVAILSVNANKQSNPDPVIQKATQRYA